MAQKKAQGTTRSNLRVSVAMLAVMSGLAIASSLYSAPPASGPSPGELAPQPSPCGDPSPGQDVTPGDSDTIPPSLITPMMVPTASPPQSCGSNDPIIYMGIFHPPLEASPEPKPSPSDFPNGEYHPPVFGVMTFAAEVPVVISSSVDSKPPVCSSSLSKPADGPQGTNWFQNSRPELVFQLDASDPVAPENDRVYIVTAANTWLEFQRFDESSETFVGTNNTTGVMVHTPRDTEDEDDHFDTYEYRDRQGMVFTFFGDDFDDSNYNDLKWQLWKIENADGESGAAYASDTQGTITEASALGAFEIESGSTRSSRLTTMFDSAGRMYTYTYGATYGGKKRLTKVEATEKVSSVDVLRGKVEYTYYTTDVSGQGNEGFLKSITVTTVLSPSNSTEVTHASTQYFRYYTASSYNSSSSPGLVGQLKLWLDADGYRRYDILSSSAFETATDSDLASYASAALTYTSDGRIWTLRSNGECGCGSGAPNGLNTYSYEACGGFTDTSSYDCAGAWDKSASWKSRTTIERPDGSYRIYYTDEYGQVLLDVIADGDPEGMTTPNFWATRYQRDSQGRVDMVCTPEAVDTYDFSSSDLVLQDSVGLVQHLEYFVPGSGPNYLLGKAVTRTLHSQGTTGTKYVDSVIQYVTSGSNWYRDHGDSAIGKPTLDLVKVYKNEIATTDSTGLSNSANYDQTQYTDTARVYWGSTSWLVKSETVTAPVVTTANHGSGNKTSTVRHLWKDGRPAFLKNQEGTYTYFAYDTSTRQLVASIQDVDDRTSGLVTSHNADASTFSITLPDDSTDPRFHLLTQTTYDKQSRPVTMTRPDGNVSAMHYTKLSDGRLVVLSSPLVDSGDYYGPASYTVRNLAGRVEASMTIALTDSMTGAPTSASDFDQWINYAVADPITALNISVVSEGSIARLSTSAYDNTGTRLVSSGAFFNIPSSLSTATEGTHYDQTTYTYDDMGRVAKVLDPTGTITRSVFDAIGRPSTRWVGTSDTSWNDTTGGGNMTKVSSTVYDSGGVGNSHVTSTTQDADGDWTGSGDARTATYKHDYRGRTIVTINPVEPHVVAKFDNRGRTLAVATYKGTGANLTTSTDPTTTATTATESRLSLNETSYDERGQVHTSIRWEILETNGSKDESLTTRNWYDPVGRLVKTTGGSLMKYHYDRLGRRTIAYTLAQVYGNSAVEADTDYAAADDVEYDLVLEENQTVYEAETGNVLFTANLQRHHDASTSVKGALDSGATTAALTTLSAADLTRSSVVIARAQIHAMWYDDLDRPIASASYGTYGLNEGGGPSSFAWSGTVPTASDTTKLVTRTTYNPDGTVDTTTDPRGIVAKSLYDDAGRPIATIANYSAHTPPLTTEDRDSNIYTRYKYTDGQMTHMWVDVQGEDTDPPSTLSGADENDQDTQYVYGTTKVGMGQVPGDGTPPVSQVASGRALLKAIYPPGATSTTEAERTVFYAYNALGEQVWTKNQNGTIIKTSLDKGGRETTRVVDTVGTNIDGTVRRIELAYTERGQVETASQYNATTSGTLLNEVTYTYDDWGNTTELEQNLDPGDASYDFSISFEYTHAQPTGGRVGGRESVRRTAMILPKASGTYDIDYYFGSSGSIDDLASRVNGVRPDSSTTNRVTYAYLGSGMLVGTDYDETSFYRHLYNSSNAYDALDRFDRVVKDRWSLGSNNAHLVNISYDESSNITQSEDTLLRNGADLAYSTAYTMDGLNRVTAADRGVLSGTIGGSLRLTEDWTLTQTGNWQEYNRILNGDADTNESSVDGLFGWNEYTDSRTHSNVNEVKTRDLTGGVSLANLDPVYDDAGQMTDDGRRWLYVYDAFGRLVQVKDKSNSNALVCEYEYDALGQRVRAWHDTDADTTQDADEWECLVYDDRWRLVTVYKETSTDPILYELNVPHAAGADGFGGSSYIDSWALRERDKNLDETIETRTYYIQNWRADVISELTDALSSWTYAGSIRYSAYGEHEFLTLGDVSDKTPVALRDGVLTSEDTSQISTWYGASNLAGDLDDGNETGVPDGNMTIDDVIFEATLYSIDGLVPDNPRFLYAGYVHDPIIGSAASALPSATGSGLYHVRNRVYNPELGRWTKRDPIGYVDSLNLLTYVSNRSISLLDPSGLIGDCADLANADDCAQCCGDKCKETSCIGNGGKGNYRELLKCLAPCAAKPPRYSINCIKCTKRNGDFKYRCCILDSTGMPPICTTANDFPASSPNRGNTPSRLPTDPFGPYGPIEPRTYYVTLHPMGKWRGIVPVLTDDPSIPNSVTTSCGSSRNNLMIHDQGSYSWGCVSCKKGAFVDRVKYILKHGYHNFMKLTITDIGRCTDGS